MKQLLQMTQQYQIITKMKNYLLITQSEKKTGKNWKILNDIQKLIEHFTQNANFSKKNFNELSPVIAEEKIGEADIIIMVVPEWNGSIPFTVKRLIDQSGWPSTFKGKKVVLIGTCGGAESNFEGIKHLRYILDYVGAIVNLNSVYFKGLAKDLPKEHYRSETLHITNLIQEICSTTIKN